MTHDVFVSYATGDKPTADAIVAELEAKRIHCWIAPRDIVPGMSYPQALIGAINQSRLMVLVFSSKSNESPQVMREVERAASKGIPILPFRIEDLPLSPGMEYFISSAQWLDALTPPLERHLQQLADTVDQLLSRELRRESLAGVGLNTLRVARDRVERVPYELFYFLALASGVAFSVSLQLFYLVLSGGLLAVILASRRAFLRGQARGVILNGVLRLLSRIPAKNRRIQQTARGVVLTGLAAPLMLWLGWAAVDDCCLGGPPKMSGDVNVLVADFGDRGLKDGGSSPESRQISLWLADSLEDRFAAQLANKDVTMRLLDSVIGGGEKEALDLGAAHGADLVIYGDVLQRSDGMFLTPRYTFTGRGTEELTPVELADLVGESSLGAPLGPIRLEEFVGGSQEISSRSEVVVSFTAGLVSLLGAGEEAVALFERTLQLYDKLELSESEVLHLFLAKALALDGTAEAYEQALPEFMAAIEINPDYARPYIGVAGWHYLKGADQLDPDSLLDAVDWYANALVAPTRPPTPVPEAKARLGIGNAYVVLAQFEDIELTEAARQEYQAVVELESACRGGPSWWDPRAWGPWKDLFESRPDYCPQLSQIVDAAEEGIVFLEGLEAGFVAAVPSPEPTPSPEASPIGPATPSPSAVAEVSFPPEESTATPVPPGTPTPQPIVLVPPGTAGPPVLGPSAPTPTPAPSAMPTPTFVPPPPTPTPGEPTPESKDEQLKFVPPVVPAIVDIFPDAVNVPVGLQPLLIGITPDGREAYVSLDFQNGEVAVIDTEPESPTWNTVTQRIDVGRGPQGIAITPDGSEAWAALCIEHGLAVIDTQTKEVTLLAMGSCPTLVAFTPDGSRAYVTDSTENVVYVVDTAKRTPLATIPVGDQPVGIAITPPDGRRAYVVNAQSDDVSVIDSDPVSTTFNKVLDETIRVGDLPDLVAITPDGSRAYVTNRESNSVSVIDTKPMSPNVNTEVDSVAVGAGPSGVALSPDGLRAYIANTFSNTLSIIDTDPQSADVLGEVAVGEQPLGVAVTPDGCFIYVANSGEVSGNVTVVPTGLAGCPKLTPPHDKFADAIEIPPEPLPYSNNQGTTGATLDTAEPQPCARIGSTVWYSFTPTVDTQIVADTIGSDFDTVLAAYTGRSLLTLSTVACNDDGGPGPLSRISFVANAGNTYHLQVGGYAGSSGSLVFNLTVPFPPMTNDEFADAILIPEPLPYGNKQDTTSASAEPGEPIPPSGQDCSALMDTTVWYKHTPSSSRTLVADTFGSNYDTEIAVWSGTGIGTLTFVGCNDEFAGRQSQVTFNATAETTYYFQLDGFAAATGNLAFNLAVAPPPPQPPLNDRFADAIEIPEQLPYSNKQDTIGATLDTAEPQPCARIGSTVWYSFTPTVDTQIVADTIGSDFDTVLAAYTGRSLLTLSNVDCDDDDGPGPLSTISLFANAGATYHFQVGGYAGSSGSLVFNLAVAPSFHVDIGSPADPGSTGNSDIEDPNGDNDPTPTATPTPRPSSTPTPTPTPTAVPPYAPLYRRIGGVHPVWARSTRRLRPVALKPGSLPVATSMPTASQAASSSVPAPIAAMMPPMTPLTTPYRWTSTMIP